MGLDAEVIAIGPYSYVVSDRLAYPVDYYEQCHTRDGATVIVKVFRADTSSQSQALAAAFGATEWDFNTHELDAAKANLEALAAEFEGLDRFVALRRAGFRFYYLPNG